MMHSMQMVHRDIKPENILFSPSRKQFVLGDFGMAALIKEDLAHKTRTRFAGTPNYCCDEMRELLVGGETGEVNLYLNDLHALKETLGYFGSSFTSYHSRISSNSMSFNELPNSYYEATSFDSGSIEVEGQDQSYNTPTINSLAAFSTTQSLAPKHDAALINHFSSAIIFKICREMEH
jgi:hypothetical protein